ncbi:hypothetical protein [Companilactobacillus mishanensis]|uniref:hypothetical protein n=1 Tax=Companilactobacillus mishanensis TaxID=2486008 RepID=UPI00129729FC|nr:hypothetical protein [Companilactobacillus mishanensis]
MENLKCENCGAPNIFKVDGMYCCSYCDSKFKPNKLEIDSVISINDDVGKLLEKMKVDRSNCQLYANLILDIDPSNKEYIKYL